MRNRDSQFLIHNSITREGCFRACGKIERYDDMAMHKKISWQSLSRETALRGLATDPARGLSRAEHARRIKKYSENTFGKERRRRPFAFVADEIKDPFALILFVAGVATFIFGKYTDTFVIFFALAVNVAVAVFQKKRTGRAFSLLAARQEKFAFVIRDGRKTEVSATSIVPGDILSLSPGQAIAADARLIETKDFSVDESLISGEWLPVKKEASKTIPREQPVSAQVNMVWMGTTIISGQGKAVVVTTGRKTQFGAIARQVSFIKETKTPLQKSTRVVATALTIIILGFVAAIVLGGVFTGRTVMEMLFLAIAVSVAAVPSGLPAAITVVLAFGMEAILKKGGLMRNLLGTETLGSTTVILVDKTGTLTEAKMRVRTVACATSLARVEKEGESEQQGFMLWSDDERLTLFHAVAASDAFVEWNLGHDKENTTRDILAGRNAERIAREGGEEGSSFVVRGRPMERAIVLGGIEAGIRQEEVLATHPQTDFLPFDSVRQFAASVHKKMGAAAHRLILVGSPEYLLARAGFVQGGGRKIAMTKEIRETLSEFQEHRSKKGERLIAVAYKDMNERTIPSALKEDAKKYDDPGLVFGGFVIVSDPIRPDARKAVLEAQEAGIRVIMVTGDNPHTAEGVATATGIMGKNDSIIEGSALVGKSDGEVRNLLDKASVFARVLPQDKQRLVQVLKARGEVVAMTGDGINDAPALKSAHLGIALGSGTDVAQESSDLILLENGLSVVILAIKEGRRILDNIQKITAYLLSTSFSEVLLIGSAIVFAGPLPLLPAQILWINIIEGGFMNFAFAFEPEEPNIMQRDPHTAAKGILTPTLKTLIAVVAATTGALLVGLYFALVRFGVPEETLRTIMFVAVAVDSVFFSFSFKNLRHPLWRIRFLGNRYLLIALVVSLVALFGAFVFPPLARLLSLEPLGGGLFLLLLGLGIINIMVIEVTKYFVFKEE